MRKLLTLALAVTAVIALSPARAQETKERAALSWKLAKGDKARYAYSYELATNQDFVGESKQKVSLHLSQEVTDLAAGTATIQAKIDRIVATFDMGMLGGKMSYDSDKEKNAKGDGDKKKDDKKKDDDDDDDDDKGGKADEDPLAVLSCAVGKVLTWKVSTDGAVTDLSGVDEISTKLVTKMMGAAGGLRGGGGQGGMPDMKKAGGLLAMVTLAGVLSSDSIQRTLDMHCHVFPKDGGKGDSWQLDATYPVATLGDFSFKRTIKSDGDGEAAGEKGVKLSHSAGDLKYSKPKVGKAAGGAPGLGAMMAQAGKTKIKKATYSGKTIFSADKGRLISGEVVQKIDSTMTVNIPGMGGGRKKAKNDDDDDDDGKKKDDGKKEEKKKDADEDDDDDDAGGGMKMGRKITLTSTYQILAGDGTPAKEEPKAETPGEKKDGKGSF